MRALITGANRGLGLGMVQLLLARGDEVYAGARDPDAAVELQALLPTAAGRLHLLVLDATERASVDAVAGRLPAGGLDLLINNAGTYGGGGSLAEVDLDDCAQTFAVNVLGTLRMVQACLPALRRPGAKIINISSLMGSIADNSGGGSYGYRMAKAALNMASKNLALELGPAGISVLALHPGWVQTRMGGAKAPLSVAASTAAMVRTIDQFGPTQNGHFLNYDAATLAW